MIDPLFLCLICLESQRYLLLLHFTTNLDIEVQNDYKKDGMIMTGVSYVYSIKINVNSAFYLLNTLHMTFM